MKTCLCGGAYHRHQTSINKRGEETQRFRCRECGKTISVRDGKVVVGRGPRVRDWRTIGCAGDKHATH